MLALLLFGLSMLLLAGFFAGVEIAFLTANKLQLALREAEPIRTARILSRFSKNGSRLMHTVLVGSNLAIVLYVIGLATTLEPALMRALGVPQGQVSGWVWVLEVASLSFFAIVLAEYLPKALFRAAPNQMLATTAPATWFFYSLLAPLVLLSQKVTKLFVHKLLRVPPMVAMEAFTRTDLQRYISEWADGPNAAAATDLDADMFRNALSFNETEVGEVMIPRTEIVAAEWGTPLPELIRKFVETGLSRLLVYDETLDNIRGYVHSTHLLTPEVKLEAILQPLMAVPESMTANMLLREFNLHQRSVAIVVDEYGGTAGLVTIEDLVEVVFGDIADEHDDAEDEDYVRQPEGPDTWLFSGRVEVADANETFGLALPEGDDYTTLAGLYMQVAEAIPNPGDSAEAGGYCLTVVQASRTRIGLLRVERVFREPDTVV